MHVGGLARGYGHHLAGRGSAGAGAVDGQLQQSVEVDCLTEPAPYVNQMGTDRHLRWSGPASYGRQHGLSGFVGDGGAARQGGQTLDEPDAEVGAVAAAQRADQVGRLLPRRLGAVAISGGPMEEPYASKAEDCHRTKPLSRNTASACSMGGRRGVVDRWPRTPGRAPAVHDHATP